MLERFVKAQEQTYSRALAEIRSGVKRGHWMWFVFPQLKGLGISEMSRYYGIEDMDEAKAYLRHPVLSKRLLEISGALLELSGVTAEDVFVGIDALKLRSSMTLFHLADPEESVFTDVLDRFFEGELDTKTIALIEQNTP